MKFCTKCGNKILGDELFCTSCGNDLKEKSTNKIDLSKKDNSVTSTPNEISQPTFRFSKGSKIGMIIIAILAIIIIIVFNVGNSLSNPKNLVTRFKKDVASNNTSDLASILYCNDSRLKVDDESISPLLAYFKSNPSYFNNVIQDLNNDAFSPKDINSLSSDSSNALTLASQGKSFFIFPKYKINIKPSFVDVTTTVKDVTFSIKNIQIGKSDTDKSTKEFGPYIPGNYTILASYKGKYVTLSKPYTVDLVTTSNGIAKLNVLEDMNYLNITSEYPTAEIFVNGKDANLQVKDAENFGPIDSGAKVYATYVKDGKTLKSEEYSSSNGDTNIDLSFQNSNNDLNDVQDQLQRLLSDYTSNFTQGVNTNTVSLIDPYVAAESPLYKTQQSYIPKTYEAGIQENVISSKIIDYTISDDNKSGSVKTTEVYNIIAKDGTSSNKTFGYTYKFQYNDSTASYQFTNIS